MKSVLICLALTLAAASIQAEENLVPRASVQLDHLESLGADRSGLLMDNAVERKSGGLFAAAPVVIAAPSAPSTDHGLDLSRDALDRAVEHGNVPAPATGGGHANASSPGFWSDEGGAFRVLFTALGAFAGGLAGLGYHELRPHGENSKSRKAILVGGTIGGFLGWYGSRLEP